MSLTPRTLPLKGKVVVVTGGAGRLGKSFVRGIVANGGVGVIADVDRSLGARVLKEIQTDFPQGRVDFIAVDITNKPSICSLLEKTATRWGRIHGVVNNAYPRNRRYGRPFDRVTYSDFCDNVSRHLGGYFLVAQQAIGYFKNNGGGAIVNMASIYGETAPRFEIYHGTEMTMPVEYAAIKSAVIHLTRYMARYCRGMKIRINTLSPGGVLDGQPTLFVDRYKAHCLNKGLLDAADVVGSLIFLLSDSARYINGQNLVVDDGFTL